MKIKKNIQFDSGKNTGVTPESNRNATEPTKS
jgi:hypothetical protein